MKTSRSAKSAAFTLVELLTVMVIISILAGMVLGIAGFATHKGAAARTEAEIKAMENGCESYKTDVGIYPRCNANGATTGSAPYDTDKLDPRVSFDPANYKNASKALYASLSGDLNFDGQKDPNATAYMAFDQKMMGRPTPSLPPGAGNLVTHIVDPFSNSYGYSTAYAYWQDAGGDPSKPAGYNPTFDLWSTLGTVITTGSDSVRWSKNW